MNRIWLTGLFIAALATWIVAQAPIPGPLVGFPTSLPPSGAAGGDLSGTYPNPSVASIGGKTVTLSGNFTTTGAFNPTLTFVAGNTYTFPNGSATLATLAANTYTARQLGFSGDCTSPTWAISNDSQTGIGNASLSQLSLCANGTQGAQVSPTIFNFINAQPQAKQYLTTTNCLSVASPAACVAAPSGSSNIVAATTSEVVNTTAVTANSNIQITEDSGLGTRLGVTCNTQSSLVVGTPRVTARVAATSFTVAVDVAPTTNPLCFSYAIQN